MNLLTFALDNARFAFPAEGVAQVVQMVEISPLPGAPAVIEGVVNVRGTMTPVLDLRARLGLPARPIDPAQHLVILMTGSRTAAVRVDAVDEFVSVADSEITMAGQLSDSGIVGVRSPHVAGVAAMADGTTVIYDLASFLTQSESSSLNAVLGPTGG